MGMDIRSGMSSLFSVALILFGFTDHIIPHNDALGMRISTYTTNVRRSTTSSLTTTLTAPLPTSPSLSFDQSTPTFMLEEKVQHDLKGTVHHL
ncbi:hypothetical protein DFJ58DRAFT_752082 [Suillus subalutaceus]|uniref:uncharacterized protein n=1 Tax=Suillus subalutaceus TaxID=48586 RepID=UPI001B873B8F|nr:uncharacterized protein DFJ58DRAFT_752082 [Suillus subalutaceus]KAG1877647.1 hypothetical protein DFJ58DRAFT_752082 [Suillus subalutaceus]